MTPFFSHIAPTLRKDERVRDAVKNVLQRFANAGIRHNDVAWRNVCLYRTADAELRAVMIDLADVNEFVNPRERDAWVKVAIERLDSSA